MSTGLEVSTGFAPEIDPARVRPAIAFWARRGLDRPRPRVVSRSPAWTPDATGDEAGESAVPIEERLARLAGSLGPLRRVLAAIAERLLATRAYERLCYARLSDYACERPGISARQLQDLARVHRALGELPALEQALVVNQLPWSKVRLLARVATAEDEASWIARARTVATRRLEWEVRDARRGGEPEAPDDTDGASPDARVTLHCSPAVRERWAVTREVAERVAGRRLPAGEALELAAAEVFSAIAIDPALADLPDEPPPRGRGTAAPRDRETAAVSRGPVREGRGGASKVCSHVRELPRRIASLGRGLAAADAFELDRRLRLAIQLEQTLDAAIAPLLRVVTSAGYEWQSDYQTLESYASEQLGMSPSKARALLRLERTGDSCPELRDAYRGGRLSWVKAQCLLPLLLLDIEGEHRPIWVAWAERVTLWRLEADVERALLLRAGHDRAWQRCKFHPERAQDPIPPDERQLCAPDVDTEATQQLSWRVPRDVAGLFFAVQATLRARLGSHGTRRLSDGEVFDAMLSYALASWTQREPGARRPNPVIERDGYLCAVPGCRSRHNLHDHHVVFRSAGGSNAEGNRITLCAFHHQRCLHAGRLGIRGRAPDGLVFELGLRPGAPPLVRYRSGDVEL